MSGAVEHVGRHWRIWLIIAATTIAAVVTLRLPPPAALASGDRSLAMFAALAAAGIVAVPGLAVFLLHAQRRRLVWLAVAAAALAAAIVAFVAAGNVQRTCTAGYAGHSVIAGTVLTPLGEKYKAADPDQTREDLLFDATGNAERVWTRESIDRCRTRLATTYSLWIPLLVLCLLGAAQAVPTTAWPGLAAGAARSPVPTAAAAAPEIRYDVFLSYRHDDTDRAFARRLLESLEGEGYAVAIDERDFRANESFLGEMERSIRQSRFTVAIVSSRYLQSGNCEEEAIICKILDMGERRRRLIPIFVEAVTTPVWLHGIVGIDATSRDPLVDPFERLRAALGAPVSRA